MVIKIDTTHESFGETFDENVDALERILHHVMIRARDDGLGMDGGVTLHAKNGDEVGEVIV